MDISLFLSTLLHLIAAVIVIGGCLSLAAWVYPASKQAQNSDFVGEFHRFFRRWLHPAVFLLLITGTYQLIQQLKSKPPKDYHNVFAVKFLLAFVVFYLAAKLATKRELPDWLKNNYGRVAWLAVCFGVLVACFGLYLGHGY